MWVVGVKGFLINLERIMSITIVEYQRKWEVRAWFNSAECNELAHFECEDHAITYLGKLRDIMKQKGLLLYVS